MKVSGLIGYRLDHWVAKAEGLEKGRTNYVAYSTVWNVGGPIIEREKIQISPAHETLGGWAAWHVSMPCDKEWIGGTALIAAMRCYVASKFGDEVSD